jgi:hypothetical protein
MFKPALTLFFLAAACSAGPINLALNKTASAESSYSGGYKCCGPEFGVDGDPDSHWSATWAPVWWQVDLGASETIGRIEYSGANNDFNLLLDGVQVTSGSTTRSSTLWTYTLATPQQAQVIRVDFTGGSDWAVVYELRAFAPDGGVVPEPATWGLIAAGALAAAVRKAFSR